MINIENIEIENYRSCLNTKFKIRNNLTAIIGANGAGKSNILNSCLLLSRVRRSRMFRSKQILDTLSKCSIVFEFKKDNEQFALKADFFFETDEKNSDDVHHFEMSFKDLNQKGNRYKKIDSELINFVNEFMMYRPSNSSLEEHLPKKFDTKINIHFIQCFLFIHKASYYSATQFSDPSKCPVSIELDGNRVHPRFRNNRSHDNFIYDLYITSQRDEVSFSRYLNTVNENGIGLITDLKFYKYDLPNSTYEVKTGGEIRQIDKQKSIVVPSFVIDKTTLTPNQLSEGTFKTLALIFYVLTDKSDLLLIEEPEVCVHHGLLNSILELIKMKSSEKQIIISTHSDFVLDKLLPENVVLIFKDKEIGTTAIEVDKFLSKGDYKALKDYLTNAGNLGEFWKEGGFDYE